MTVTSNPAPSHENHHTKTITRKPSHENLAHRFSRDVVKRGASLVSSSFSNGFKIVSELFSPSKRKHSEVSVQADYDDFYVPVVDGSRAPPYNIQQPTHSFKRTRFEDRQPESLPPVLDHRSQLAPSPFGSRPPAAPKPVVSPDSTAQQRLNLLSRPNPHRTPFTLNKSSSQSATPSGVFARTTPRPQPANRKIESAAASPRQNWSSTLPEKTSAQKTGTKHISWNSKFRSPASGIGRPLGRAPYTDGKFSSGTFVDLTMELGEETSVSIATLGNMTKKSAKSPAVSRVLDMNDNQGIRAAGAAATKPESSGKKPSTYGITDISEKYKALVKLREEDEKRSQAYGGAERGKVKLWEAEANSQAKVAPDEFTAVQERRMRAAEETKQKANSYSTGAAATKLQGLFDRLKVDPLTESRNRMRDADIELLELKRQALQELDKQPNGVAEPEEEEEQEEEVEEEDPLLRPLSAEEEAKVDAALGPGPSAESLSNSTFTNIDIKRSDLECMIGLNWLNDEVINFFMGLLQQRELRLNPGKPRCHFFNTFFYNSLFSNARKYDYKKVRRWSGKKLGYSILDCDKIVIPIHQGMHWVLAVINIAETKLQFFDSMGGSDKASLANLARYITDEYWDKRQETVDGSTWETENPRNIPHQDNCSDCGVFMVTFAEFTSRDCDFNFRQQDMPFIRRRLTAEILNGIIE